jgi:hypothetical protein
VTSLYEESYVNERLRVSAYERMAARVVEAALDLRVEAMPGRNS